MAIGDKKVKSAIIVIVEKTATEAEYVVGGNRDAGLIADFLKYSLSFVVPERSDAF